MRGRGRRQIAGWTGRLPVASDGSRGEGVGSAEIREGAGGEMGGDAWAAGERISERMS